MNVLYVFLNIDFVRFLKSYKEIRRRYNDIEKIANILVWSQQDQVCEDNSDLIDYYLNGVAIIQEFYFRIKTILMWGNLPQSNKTTRIVLII
jgi:hypothetical protein